jgi:hypothetical protein
VNAERPSAVGASKPEPHPEAQPIHLPQDAKDPLRPVWYRVHRDHEYAPSNVEARFLCERITKERHEAAKLRGEVDVLVGRLERAEEALRKIASGELSTRRISDEVDVVIDGKPGKIISVVGLRPSEVAREALGVPPPGGPDS